MPSPSITTTCRGFARAWDAALEVGRMRAREEAMRIEREGRLIPITRGGRVIGHRRVFDNPLLFTACYGELMSRYERRDSH